MLRGVENTRYFEIGGIPLYECLNAHLKRSSILRENQGKNGLIYVISSSDFKPSSMVLIFFAPAFLIINKFENHR